MSIILAVLYLGVAFAVLATMADAVLSVSRTERWGQPGYRGRSNCQAMAAIIARRPSAMAQARIAESQGRRTLALSFVGKERRKAAAATESRAVTRRRAA